MVVLLKTQRSLTDLINFLEIKVRAGELTDMDEVIPLSINEA